MCVSSRTGVDKSATFLKGDQPENWRVPPQELDRRQYVSTSTSGCSTTSIVLVGAIWNLLSLMLPFLQYRFSVGLCARLAHESSSSLFP